ncbi:MAG TPA: phosphodiester glycosidase family protein [Trebonia sp.]|nr:phosphodiester glycosidase family protein [Trebonia sp.]
MRSELVLFTSQFGAATPHGPGTQAVLNSAGTVLSAGRRAGGRVPAAGWVIQGIGAAGAWLRRYAIRSRHLSISERLADTAGHAIPLTQGLSVGSAAPILVSRSRVAIDADREGVTLAEEAALMLSLGAVSAMNLDGGGSTAMAVQGQLVSRPSDGAERADGDFVVVRP